MMRMRRTHAKEILAEAQVPDRAGVIAGPEDCRSGRQGIWRPPQFGQQLERTLLEKGPEIFAQDSTVAEYERRLAQLERLIGKKEVEIALLKNFLGQTR